MRATDTVARFGGDEFVVVLEDVNRPESLDEIVANLRQRLAQAIPIEGRHGHDREQHRRGALPG